MTLKAIRASLAEAIKRDGLHVYGYEPGSVVAPAAVIRSEPMRYAAHNGGLAQAPSFAVLLLAPLGEDGQDQVDDLVDATNPASIPRLVNADATLGGTVARARVSEVRRAGIVEYGGVQYNGASLVVQTGSPEEARTDGS